LPNFLEAVLKEGDRSKADSSVLKQFLREGDEITSTNRRIDWVRMT